MQLRNPIWLIATLLVIQIAVGSTARAEDPAAYMSAVALNVKDLEKSTAFYTEVFGMQINRNYNTDTMNENIMGVPNGEGASLVLVQYKNKDFKAGDKPARIVFYAADPKAVIEKGLAMGATIITEPREIASLNTVIGIMRDLDGYPVEVIKRRQ